MRNLLSANFLRLRKSKFFWGLLLILFGLGVLFTFRRVSDQMKWGARFYLTVDLFTYPLFLGFGMAAFIPLFFGAEYSDGAIRNKLLAGHSRLTIYLSHLITSITVALSAAAAYILPVLAIGAFAYEPPDVDPGMLLLILLGSLVVLAAYCALYTLVMMNCASKSGAAVICLVGMLVLYLAAAHVETRLIQPEYIGGGVMITDDGVEVSLDAEPNPRYVGGAQRETLETVLELLPTGQSIQFMRVDVAHPVQLPLYSLVDIAVLTAIGGALFRRKDLK